MASVPSLRTTEKAHPTTNKDGQPPALDPLSEAHRYRVRSLQMVRESIDYLAPEETESLNRGNLLTETDTLTITENDLRMHVQFATDRSAQLMAITSISEDASFPGNPWGIRYALVDIQTGKDIRESRPNGSHHAGAWPSSTLRYERHSDTRNSHGRKIEIEQTCPGLRVTTHWQFYEGIPVLRCWADVINEGNIPIPLSYVSSFTLTGLAEVNEPGFHDGVRLWLARNSWGNEVRWQSLSLEDAGWPLMSESTHRLAFHSTGTWPANGLLPTAAYENTRSGITRLWQIESAGSWEWELATVGYSIALHAGGPTYNESHWEKLLHPGESFSSVPVAVVTVAGDFTAAIQAMNSYRRAMRRPCWDNEDLPVIFNDYMNCLHGQPTIEKLRPLIDTASEMGCEVFCIDAGWYTDAGWDQGLGEWYPSKMRFPSGIEEPLGLIRDRGMTPGLWLEPEVMAATSDFAASLPDDWFFIRHGARIVSNGRVLLDYRNPAVRDYMDEVIDRVVGRYCVGYLKFDFNAEFGPGTELASDSLGDGLLEHNRAYHKWLDGVFQRYPDLVIENCGSGGLRMTYGFLDSHSVQSTSDQQNYVSTAYIAVASPSALTPEQCGTWSYPLPGQGEDAVVMNMVNAMLLRVFLSGRVPELPPKERLRVAEGIAVYKSIRRDIRDAQPFWPLGLPVYPAEWLCLGLDCGAHSYIGIWRMNGEPNRSIEIPALRGLNALVEQLYPLPPTGSASWQAENGTLHIKLENSYSAALLKLAPR